MQLFNLLSQIISELDHGRLVLDMGGSSSLGGFGVSSGVHAARRVPEPPRPGTNSR